MGQNYALNRLNTNCIQGAEEGKKKKAGGDEAKKALKNLLKSGIPGIEGMFGAEPPTPR